MSKIPKNQVDFKKINMNSSKTFFSDAMGRSLFNFQPALPQSGVSGKGNSKTTSMASSRRRSTSHAIGTRNFI